MLRILLLTFLMLACMGCQLVPDASHQPMVHNPFPQLHRVAVAPFINLSNSATVDGEQFGEAYFSELQTVPGFEVLPPNVVVAEMNRHGILKLDSPSAVRKLAQILEVDAIVIGTVTDFTPYYPPRVGMKVEWHAANPCFHSIPAGYGLPWGTPEEEFIPDPLVFEAEFALARSQLKTQTPAYQPEFPDFPEPQELMPVRPGEMEPMPLPHRAGPSGTKNNGTGNNGPGDSHHGSSTKMSFHQASVHSASDIRLAQVESIPLGELEGTIVLPDRTHEAIRDTPPGWPDERAFIPPPPALETPKCKPQEGPVMSHTRIYQGNDSLVTEALASYAFFRDDARQGGWQSYLRRSDDYIRFCCHMHIYEMLSARGGGGETRVVWRWFDSR